MAWLRRTIDDYHALGREHNGKWLGPTLPDKQSIMTWWECENKHRYRSTYNNQARVRANGCLQCFRLRHSRPIPRPGDLHTCVDCQQSLPIEDYYWKIDHKSKKRLPFRFCKICYGAKYYDKAAAYQRQYQKVNAQKLNTSAKRAYKQRAKHGLCLHCGNKKPKNVIARSDIYWICRRCHVIVTIRSHRARLRTQPLTTEISNIVNNDFQFLLSPAGLLGLVSLAGAMAYPSYTLHVRKSPRQHPLEAFKITNYSWEVVRPKPTPVAEGNK